VPSTIADELATNPFLRHASSTLRASVALDAAPGDSALEVFTATRALKNKSAYKAQGDAGLPL
jgi:hypothetical protein